MPTKKVTRKRVAPKKPVQARSEDSHKTIAMYGGFILFGLIFLGGTILLGRTDGGQIDVSGTIRQSNEAAAQAAADRGEAPPTPVVADTRASQPNGGLKPRDENAAPVSPSPQPVPEAPAPDVESASTTDETASSTDDGSDETDEGSAEDTDDNDEGEANTEADTEESAPETEVE